MAAQLTQVSKTRLVNLDHVASVEYPCRQQRPDWSTRKAEEQHPDDALKINFLGTLEPLVLFDDDAKAFAETVGYKAPEPAKPTPADKPAIDAPKPAAIVPAPAPAKLP